MRIFFQAAVLVALISFTQQTYAAEFSCDEAGLDAAIAAAEDLVSPDPGPHTFDCAGPSTISAIGPRFIQADITLDGLGRVTFDLGDTAEVSVLASRFTNWTNLPQPPPGIVVELRNLNMVGGGLWFMRGSTVRLTNVHLSGYSGGSAQLGVGFEPVIKADSDDIVELIDSEVSGNGTCGIQSTGTVVVDGSTIAGNQNGAICTAISGEDVTIERSTISGNTGGLSAVDAETLTVLNSTISGNTALGECDTSPTGTLSFAGGIQAVTMDIQYSTVVDNIGPASTNISFGRILFAPSPPGSPPNCFPLVGLPVIVENSIIESSCANPSAVSPVGGGNIESPGNTCLFTDPTDQVNVTPGQLNLDVLADNFGPTETHALLPGSVAIDSAVLANCPLTDQRGAPRPEDGGTDCDSGSFEVLPEPAPVTGLLAGVGILTSLFRNRVRS